MSLIGRAKAIFDGLDIKQLQEAGIEREDVKISSHSHHIVTYPPFDALPEIKPSEIYPDKRTKSSGDVAIYLHLPFCTGRCLYCAYASLPNQPAEYIDRYIDAVEKEASLLLRHSNLRNMKINSVFIGGGTPTYLSAGQLDKVLGMLRSKFDIKAGAEVTVEAAPETITCAGGEEKLQTLIQNGINRLSIGFQTFDDNILKSLGRRHDSRQAAESYGLARKAGFDNINIDLIMGLPGQTLEIWSNDLERIGRLGPASVTCYPLSIKQSAGLWWMFQRERQMFPSKENVLIMHIMANEFFSELGYGQRPVWWFAKNPGYVYRQQIHKWGEAGESIALGVSGYSFINGFQYFNCNTIPRYLEAVENGNLPICRGVKLPEEDLMRRLVLFGLKTGLSKALFKSKFGKMPKDVFGTVWEKLENLGLVEEDGETVRLSYKGMLFADEVSREFYSESVKKAIAMRTGRGPGL